MINPLHTRFPGDTVVPGSFAVTLTWTLPNRTTGVFNVTSPLPGDWFLAAHLPKDEGKISVKVCVNRVGCGRCEGVGIVKHVHKANYICI